MRRCRIVRAVSELRGGHHQDSVRGQELGGRAEVVTALRGRRPDNRAGRSVARGDTPGVQGRTRLGIGHVHDPDVAPHR